MLNQQLNKAMKKFLVMINRGRQLPYLSFHKFQYLQQQDMQLMIKDIFLIDADMRNRFRNLPHGSRYRFRLFFRQMNDRKICSAKEKRVRLIGYIQRKQMLKKNFGHTSDSLLQNLHFVR